MKTFNTVLLVIFSVFCAINVFFAVAAGYPFYIVAPLFLGIFPVYFARKAILQTEHFFAGSVCLLSAMFFALEWFFPWLAFSASKADPTSVPPHSIVMVGGGILAHVGSMPVLLIIALAFGIPVLGFLMLSVLHFGKVKKPFPNRTDFGAILLCAACAFQALFVPLLLNFDWHLVLVFLISWFYFAGAFCRNARFLNLVFAAVGFIGIPVVFKTIDRSDYLFGMLFKICSPALGMFLLLVPSSLLIVCAFFYKIPDKNTE